MANLHYVGKNGQVPEPTLWEQQKADGQEILNEIARTKLKKLRGDLLDRREVEFVVGNAITQLRAQLLRLPLLVASELRDLSYDRLFAIRTRTEKVVHDFLLEVSEALSKAVDPRAVAELEREDEMGQDSAEATRAKEDVAALKKKIANETRRAKRRSKQQAHGH